MEIFLVRHGQTGGNVARRHQNEISQLTSEGEEQVRRIAKKIKEYRPTHLVTSSLVRTIETARIIGECCNLVPETSYHFIELRRPDELYGNFHFSFKSIWFYLNWFFGRPDKRFNNGESYDDLLERIKRAKEYLSKLPADARVVVVSHSVFINFFVVHLCQDKKLNLLQAVNTFKNVLLMPNTQITALTFDATNNTGKCAWVRKV